MSFILEWGPFLITVIYTIATILIAMKAGEGQDEDNAADWAVSGNTMGSLVLVFLLGGSVISAYTFMGAPGWAFQKGVGILYVSIYLALMQLVSYIVSPRILKLSMNHDIYTQPSAIGIRYESRGMGILGAVAGSITMVAYSVVQIVGCGYILNILSGGRIPMWVAELIIMVVIFAQIYKSGLKSVGWMSVLQGVLMFVVSLSVSFMLIKHFTGGYAWRGVFEKLREVSPEHLTLPGALGDFSPMFWTTSILVSVISYWPNTWISSAGGESGDALRKSTSLVPIYHFVMMPMMIVGFIAVFALPNYTGPIDKIGLTMGMQSLHWWLSGLLGAGTLAAAQSSCAPLFQALALTWTQDVFVPLGWVNKDKIAKTQRLMLIPFMFLIVLPIAMTNPANLVYILLVGYGFLAQLAPVLIGLFAWPRSTKQGAFAGLFIGLMVTIYFSFVTVHPLGVHAGIWGVMINIVIHVLVSLMTEPASEETIRVFFEDDLIEELYE